MKISHSATDAMCGAALFEQSIMQKACEKVTGITSAKNPAGKVTKVKCFLKLI